VTIESLSLLLRLLANARGANAMAARHMLRGQRVETV
jgi:hypothetical protein